MTKQTINIGTSENSNNGDPLRTAFTKINENFDELYDSNTLADSPADFGSTIIPKTDGTYSLGNTTHKWDEIHANQVFARDWIDINGSKLTVDANGNLNFPGIINATVRTKQDIQGDIFADDSTRVFDSATGRFTGDLSGSIFADDSTLLVDGTNGSVNLDGTVKGDIIPDTDVAYDLGSATNRFRDLYLSGNTINLGGITISTDPVTGTVNLPINTQTSLGIPADVGITGFYGFAPDTVGGLTIDTNNSVPVTPNPVTDAIIGPIFAYSKIVFATPIPGFSSGIEYDYFNFPEITLNGKTPPTIVADIDGSGNLISLEITNPGNATGLGESLGFGPTGDSFAYGVELNDNGDTGTIVTTQGGVIAGNVTGNVTGDLKGSVFADDSTLLVDAVNGEIPGYVKITDLKTALQDGAGDYAAFKAWVLANL